MTTELKRIAGYVPEHIEIAFKEWKLKNKIAGDSEAINVLLSQFFFGDNCHQKEGLEGINRRLHALEQRVSRHSILLLEKEAQNDA